MNQCNAVATWLNTTLNITSVSVSLAPDMTADDGVYVTPISSEVETEGRGELTETTLIQVVFASHVDSPSSSEAFWLIESVLRIRTMLVGAKLTYNNESFRVQRAEMSGTQFLSSSSLSGGIVDSKELNETFVCQIPFVVEMKTI